MLYVGLDVHQRSTAVCVLEENGAEREHRNVKGHPSNTVEWLRGLGEPFAVCYEASCGYGWLHDRLHPIAAKVVVAHPAQLRLIFRSKRKNDRVDAQKLAKLLFLGEVPAVHVPPPATRAWRSLVEYRQRCVGERTRGKNGLRAVFRTYGVETPRGDRLWSCRGLKAIEALGLPTSGAALERDQLIDDIRHHSRKIKRVEEALLQEAEQRPGVALLRTIPGVGIRTAEAFVAYVDDPSRFSSIRSIGCYLGLVPRQDASGGVNQLGGISKAGPATLRKLLTEAAWQGVIRSPTIRAYHQRMKHGQADRKKKALVGTAHYLARVMLAMLKSGQEWRESVIEEKKGFGDTNVGAAMSAAA